MQLTVLCLLGVTACAYAQIGGGVGFFKNVSLTLPLLGTFEVQKGAGIGFDTNNRRRRDAPDVDQPKGPRILIARRPGFNFGGRFKPRPGAEDSDEAGENRIEPQRPKFGFGPPRHPSPHRPPFPPKHGHPGRKSTTTESSAESSSYSSSEASNESSSEQKNEASSEASNESSSESNSEASSQSSNEANNESGSNESSEASNDSSNESDSNSSN